MTKKSVFFLALIPFLLTSGANLWAAPATVTNNGNIPVRVQYKAPDGTYEDLGQLQPGATASVPGGVEKIKIVRNLGEWAQPFKAGEILEVAVHEGDHKIGTMTWYGGKVFFDGLTEDPPLVSTGTDQTVVQTSKPPTGESPPQQTTPETQKTEVQETPKPQSSNWPWFGGWMDYFFVFQLFLLWPAVLLLWLRKTRATKLRLGDQWVEGADLGWGWGWKSARGCGWYGLRMGLILGLVFSTIALWGNGVFGSNKGFIPLFGQDLYMLPLLILSQFQIPVAGVSAAALVICFWTLVCVLMGGLGGIIPIKWFYALPMVLMTAPFFLLMRGCSGGNAFALDGGYAGMELYPPAFTSYAGFSMIMSAFLNWIDPYCEMDEEDEEEAAVAMWSLLRGNPWPMLVFLTGGCLFCFYGMADYYGWDYAIASYFSDLPLSLGLDFIPPVLMIILFWLGLSGVLGASWYGGLGKFSFYALLIPAFLSLLLLTTGSYPQRNLDFYERPAILSPALEILGPAVLGAVAGEVARAALFDAQDRSGIAPGDPFGDRFQRLGGYMNRGFSARDLQIQEAYREDRWQK